MTYIWNYLTTHLRGKTFFITTVTFLSLGNSRRLRVNAKNGEFVAIVLPDMPSKLRNNLMNTLKLVFPGKIKQTSSEVLGENFTFEALHFSWYNRFHLRVSLFLTEL